MLRRTPWIALSATLLIACTHGLGKGDLGAAATPSTPAAAAPVPPKLKVTRFKENPIIRPEMLPEGDGENINGPSLIKVPDWIEKPLGKYYLYFSHHKGPHIRLAYADRLAGPWKVYGPGTLSVQQVASTNDYRINNKSHIAIAELTW